MAGQNIPIRDIPGDLGQPTANAFVAMDDGTQMLKTSVQRLVEAGRVTATQQQALDATDNYSVMTPLRVLQSVNNIIPPELLAGVSQSALNAAQSEANAAQSALAADNFAQNSAASAGTASGAAATAQTSAGQAMSFRNGAQDAQTASEAARDASQVERVGSETARDAAAGYASDAVSQGNVPIYASVSGMSALEVPQGINFVRVNGFLVAGDGRQESYRRLNGSPQKLGFRTADRWNADGQKDLANGGWWEIVERTHNFPGDGAIFRTINVNLNKFPTPEDYDADPSGARDSTAAFARALAAHDTVYIKNNGKYTVSGPIPLTRTGHALLGDGNGQGTITSISKTSDLITLAAGVAGMKVAGISLYRNAPAPPTGGFAIACLGSTDRSEISDVHMEGHYSGLRTSTCDTGKLTRITSKKNILDGWFATNQGNYGPAQWEVDDILLAQNGRDGVRVQSVAGPAGLILGTWNSLKTFANTGRGVILLGSAGAGVFDMRLSNPFIGSDGAGGIYVDGYGGKHVITGGFVERCGMDPTGPANSTPASNNAPGVQIAGHETDPFTMVGVLVDTNSRTGIRSGSGPLSLAGCQVLNNGQALASGDRSGISIDGGSASVTGGKSGNTGTGVSQAYGFAYSVDAINICGVDLRGNATFPIYRGATATANNSSLNGNTPGAANGLA